MQTARATLLPFFTPPPAGLFQFLFPNLLSCGAPPFLHYAVCVCFGSSSGMSCLTYYDGRFIIQAWRWATTHLHAPHRYALLVLDLWFSFTSTFAFLCVRFVHLLPSFPAITSPYTLPHLYTLLLPAIHLPLLHTCCELHTSLPPPPTHAYPHHTFTAPLPAPPRVHLPHAAHYPHQMPGWACLQHGSGLRCGLPARTASHYWVLHCFRNAGLPAPAHLPTTRPHGPHPTPVRASPSQAGASMPSQVDSTQFPVDCCGRRAGGTLSFKHGASSQLFWVLD